MSQDAKEIPGPALTRQQFLKTAGLMGVSFLMETENSEAQTAPGSASQMPAPASLTPPAPLPMTNTGSDQIPHKPLGKTGETVSILGMGGHHLGDVKSVDEAVRMVQEAVDAGITFFDNCWEYWNGRSEDWLGRGLKGRRDRVFLMTKVCTHGRSGELGLQMLDESLRRLQTDHLDLWQVHAISFDNDPELAYARGGILEAMDRAKKDGKVRFVGFTGHKDPGLHLKMIELGYPFDTVQMPLNVFDANFFSFQHQVLPEAARRGIGVLGMKPMGGTAESIKKGLVRPEELLRYAMSLPVATTICGMDSPEVLRQNIQTARGFHPMAAQEMLALQNRLAPMAGDGRFEVYKVSLMFDNPETRRPHGFPIDPQQKEVKEMFQHPVGLPGPDQTVAQP
ncbi:MAG TPA: aldo/keto reductase [Chthonomonadaceae bacterium]|nr:aldo/keto reductase [Chthonomonadaceae bacterium]